MNIADLKLGDEASTKESTNDTKGPPTDPMGDVVLEFCGRNPPNYAVYRTKQRVKVMFADDPVVSATQRRALAPLNPLRGEIVGLIDGWQKPLRKTDSHSGTDRDDDAWYKPSTWPRMLRRSRAKHAERYNRRVGDALIVAIEGDVEGAAALLGKIKQDILDERTAWARFQYLMAAFGQALFAGALLVVLYWLQGVITHGQNYDANGWDVLHAAAAGALGAFFSIALGIRGRTVLPDLQWLSNVMDAILRVMIGMIAAGLLMALVLTDTVQVRIGETDLKALDGETYWLVVLLIGVVAGFSERLVPDLLEKATLKERGADPQTAFRPAPRIVLPDGPKDGAAAPPSAIPPPPDGPQLDDEEDHACEDHTDAPPTLDKDLPAASGGVAKEGA